jgi:hypothetical protein
MVVPLVESSSQRSPWLRQESSIQRASPFRNVPWVQWISAGECLNWKAPSGLVKVWRLVWASGGIARTQRQIAISDFIGSVDLFQMPFTCGDKTPGVEWRFDLGTGELKGGHGMPRPYCLQESG